MLGRRGFLKAIGAGVLGLSLALRTPEAKPEFQTISIDQQFGVDFQWDDIEAALKLEGPDNPTVMHFYANDWDRKAIEMSYPPRYRVSL